MFEKLELTRMAQQMAAHAGARMGLIARNVANADTPGYKAMDLAPFAQTYRDLADGPALRTTRAGHLGSGTAATANPVFRPQIGAVAPNGNAVSLETEMVKSAEVRQQHDMALAIYKSTSDILRTALGRPR